MVYTHTRAIYNGLIREFLAAMPRICENCGAASPSIVRDGFLKLFEVPIKSKSKQFATNAMPTKSALDFLTVSQLAKMEGVEEKEPEFAEAEMEEEEEAPALADDAAALKTTLTRLADQRQLDLILTTGGTGFGPRDVTPEATMAVATRMAPGIAEAIRAASLAITPRAMLSRAGSVIRGKTLIVNLPGSPKAVCESMDVFLPQMPHALGLLRGEVRDCAR